MESTSAGSIPAADYLIGSGEMATLIRSRDWSATPLGPIDDWPQSLRTTVSLCLGSNFPINIIWGPQHTQIYADLRPDLHARVGGVLGRTMPKGRRVAETLH